MRLFFAVKAGTTVSEKVRDIISKSGISRAPWRWISPGNYHFTLKFLGEVEESMVPPLFEAAGRAASCSTRFRLGMGGIGAFPDLDRPRVIYYGIDSGFEQLRDLAASIEDECAGLGFERENKKFRAHLTLARVKRTAPGHVLEELRGFPPLGADAVVDVGHFVLMSSRLTPSGAIYEEMGRFLLSG
jgi:2'-5' RNA ligase